jgi:hypothetical protein
LSLQNVFNIANVFCKSVLCSANVLPLSACFLNMCFVLTCAFLSQDKIALVWLKEKKSVHKSSHSGRHNVYTAAENPHLLESGKSGSARIRRTVAEIFIRKNKYQRRNLLLYYCLLESGLRKFNISQQVSLKPLNPLPPPHWNCCICFGGLIETAETAFVVSLRLVNLLQRSLRPQKPNFSDKVWCWKQPFWGKLWCRSFYKDSAVSMKPK